MGQSAHKTLDTGSYTTELRENTFELGSNINETTTLGGDPTKDKNLSVPMSTRISRRISQMTQQSAHKSVDSVSCNEVGEKLEAKPKVKPQNKTT